MVEIYTGDTTWLTRITSRLKQIDLSCKLVAPVIVGSIVKAGNLVFLSLIVALFNIAMVMMQLSAIELIYKLVPSLSFKEPPAVTVSTVEAIDFICYLRALIFGSDIHTYIHTVFECLKTRKRKYFFKEDVCVKMLCCFVFLTYVPTTKSILRQSYVIQY